MAHWSKHRGYSHPHLQMSPGDISHLGTLLMKTDAGSLKEEIRRWTPHSNQISLSSTNQNITDSNLRLSANVRDCFSSGKLLHAPPSFTTVLPFLLLWWKPLTRSAWESVCFGSEFKGRIHHGKRNRRWPQAGGKSDQCLCSDWFLLFKKSRTQTHGLESVLRWIFPPH